MLEPQYPLNVLLNFQISDRPNYFLIFQSTSSRFFLTFSAVTCRHEDALPTEDYFMQPYFHIQTTIGDLYNVTSHDGNDYNYFTVLRFFCQEGFETANENKDMNITCGPQGLWQPRLTACIGEKSPKLSFLELFAFFVMWGTSSV